MRSKPPDTRLGYGQNLLCAGTAASIGRLVVHPFSFLKIYAEAGGAGGKMGPSRTLQFFRRYEGVGAVARGAGISAARAFAHYGIMFSAYDQFAKQWIPPHRKNQDIISLQQLTGAWLSGAFAGTLATVVTHPMDMVKVRLIAQPLGVQNHYYSGTSGALTQIGKEGIYKGIYRGLGPSLIGGAWFAADFFCIMYFLENIPWRRRGVKFLGGLDDLVCASMAFGGAAFINHPIDVIRRKVMAQSASLPKQGWTDLKFKNILELTVQMWRSNGIWSFYQGLLPNMIKVGPQVIAFAVVYSMMKNGFLKMRDSEKLTG